jgi:predicted N-acetyltransferase YhbS
VLPPGSVEIGGKVADMLVKLYDLPKVEPLLERLQARGIAVRHARPNEKQGVLRWVSEMFGAQWAGECDVAFGRQPVSCRIAEHEGKIVGFACYEAACRDFFGPMGVAEPYRRRGIGAALLLSCLHAMAGLGYAYAIIGGVGPAEFYGKVAGAREIEGSSPGIYGAAVLRES